MTNEIPEFGIAVPGATYVLRPGGYAVILVDGGQVAVVSVRLGLVLPGGGQDRHELPEEAAVREVAEECGLAIRPGTRIGVADELVYAAENQTYYRKRCTFIRAEVIGLCQSCEPDHELRWITPNSAVTTLLHESQQWAVAMACGATRLDE